jgi:hypothetical protein
MHDARFLSFIKGSFFFFTPRHRAEQSGPAAPRTALATCQAPAPPAFYYCLVPHLLHTHTITDKKQRQWLKLQAGDAAGE